MKNKTFVTRIAVALSAVMLLFGVGFSPVETYAEQNETTYTESSNLRDLERMTSTDAYQISLSKNIRLGSDLTITKGFAILDLNGHSIDCNGHSIILSDGTLIITDSSNSEQAKIIQTKNGNAPVVVNGGELTISGGTFVSNVGDNFKLAFGNVTVNGGTFSTASGHNMVVLDANLIINDGTFTVSNGYNNNVQTGNYFERSYTGQATVNGGNFTSDFANIHPFCSTITINDGSFTSDYAVLMRSTTSSLILNGGTYIAEDNTCMCDDDFALCLLDMLGSGKSLYRIDNQQEILMADDYRMDYTDSDDDTYPLGPSYVGGLPKGTYIIKNTPVIDDNDDENDDNIIDDNIADDNIADDNITDDDIAPIESEDTESIQDTVDNNTNIDSNTVIRDNTSTDENVATDNHAAFPTVITFAKPFNGPSSVEKNIFEVSGATWGDAKAITNIDESNTAKAAFFHFPIKNKYIIILITLILIACIIYKLSRKAKNNI